MAKNTTPIEWRKQHPRAHGGDKFKQMKTLVVSGTADVSGSPTRTFPAPFIMTIRAINIVWNSTPFVHSNKSTTDSNVFFERRCRLHLSTGLLTAFAEKLKKRIILFLRCRTPKRKTVSNNFARRLLHGFFRYEKNGQIKGMKRVMR